MKEERGRTDRTMSWEEPEKHGGSWRVILLAAVCALLLVAACILGHRVGQLRDANIALTEEAGRLSAEIGRLEKEMDDLQQELQQAEEELRTTKEQLQEAKAQARKTDDTGLTAREWLEQRVRQAQ